MPGVDLVPPILLLGSKVRMLSRFCTHCRIFKRGILSVLSLTLNVDIGLFIPTATVTAAVDSERWAATIFLVDFQAEI